MLGESTAEGVNEDYEERAPYLIAVFCSECSDIDKAYRSFYSMPEAEEVSEIYVGLDENFPCASRLAASASVYLAAMLVMESNQELSDRLFSKFTDMISAICQPIGVCARVESIIDKYL